MRKLTRGVGLVLFIGMWLTVGAAAMGQHGGFAKKDKIVPPETPPGQIKKFVEEDPVWNKSPASGLTEPDIVKLRNMDAKIKSEVSAAVETIELPVGVMGTELKLIPNIVTLNQHQNFVGLPSNPVAGEIYFGIVDTGYVNLQNYLFIYLLYNGTGRWVQLERYTVVGDSPKPVLYYDNYSSAEEMEPVMVDSQTECTGANPCTISWTVEDDDTDLIIGLYAQGKGSRIKIIETDFAGPTSYDFTGMVHGAPTSNNPIDLTEFNFVLLICDPFNNYGAASLNKIRFLNGVYGGE